MTTQTEVKHTPGPWLKSGCVVLSNDEDRGMRFATAERVRGRNPEEQEANARLIAAAPELLEAIKELIHLPGYNAQAFGGAVPMAKILKAIDKAEGRI